jgi:hypothetical protein
MSQSQPNVINSVNRALRIMKSGELQEFFKTLNSPHKFPFGLWFRGHSRTVAELQPRAFRSSLPHPSTQKGSWDETNVYDHLKLRAPSHESTYHSPFDWLCFMQHYLVPTRLLDWTESILSALYFAVKDAPGEDGELILLNAMRLNYRSKNRFTISSPDDAHVIIRAEMATTRSLRTLMCKKTVLAALEQDTRGRLRGDWIRQCRRPIAVFPRRLNDRMIFQSSVFTIHGGKVYSDHLEKLYLPEDRMPASMSLTEVDKEYESQPILKRYSIPKKKKPDILDDLFKLGVHEAMLFPEIDRQAEYLQRLWWYDAKQ